MIIRNEQLAAVREHGLERFRRELAARVRSYAPEIASIVGETGVRQIVLRAMERSRQHQFEKAGPIQLYLELMLSFGSDFDTDPAIPWAKEFLIGTEFDQMERAGGLYAAASRYLEEVAGPNNRFALAACGRAAEVLTNSPDLHGTDLDGAIVRGMNDIYPEKSMRAGEGALLTLVAKAKIVGAAYSVTGPEGLALLAGLLFGFGHGVVGDPAYPWIVRTLADVNVVGVEDRVARLQKKVMVYASQILKNHGSPPNA